jgi:uncharacterized membrane protein (DUF106 family)
MCIGKARKEALYNIPIKKFIIGEQNLSIMLDPAIVILILTIVLAIVSKFIQRKFVDKQKMRSFKARVKEKQAEVKKLVKEGKQDQVGAAQKEMLAINSEMMQQTMKATWISLPIFLVSFAAMGFFYGGVIINSLIPLPLFINWAIWNPASWIPVGVTMTTGYYKAYFFYYLIATIVFTVIEKVYDKVK